MTATAINFNCVRESCLPRTTKRRVLFLLPSLAGGGSERVMVTLLQHLNRESFDVHLGVLDAHGPLLAELPADIDVHNLNCKRVRHSVVPLLRLIWSLRPEIVLSTLGHLNLALLALRPLLPGAFACACVRARFSAHRIAQKATLMPGHVCSAAFIRLQMPSFASLSR